MFELRGHIFLNNFENVISYSYNKPMFEEKKW